MEITIREIKKEELSILSNMLYEAIFQPEDAELLPYDVIRTPEISLYIDNFLNRKDDYCFVADLGGKVIGAVWVRILADKIKGFGNIDNETPEFAISLFKEHRNKGVWNTLDEQNDRISQRTRI